MSHIFQRAKGVLFGTRIRSDEVSLFAVNMLSSVVYVPQFILMAIAVTGAATSRIALGTALVIVSILILTLIS